MGKVVKQNWRYILVRYERKPRTVFIRMFETPKIPKQYADLWAWKISRDFLRKFKIPWKDWCKYVAYPVDHINCNQYVKSDLFYSHVHIAGNDKKSDLEEVKYNKKLKGAYCPPIKE